MSSHTSFPVTVSEKMPHKYELPLDHPAFLSIEEAQMEPAAQLWDFARPQSKMTSTAFEGQDVVLIHTEEVRAAWPAGKSGRGADVVAYAAPVVDSAAPAFPNASTALVSVDDGPEIVNSDEPITADVP